MLLLVLLLVESVEPPDGNWGLVYLHHDELTRQRAVARESLHADGLIPTFGGSLYAESLRRGSRVGFAALVRLRAARSRLSRPGIWC